VLENKFFSFLVADRAIIVLGILGITRSLARTSQVAPRCLVVLLVPSGVDVIELKFVIIVVLEEVLVKDIVPHKMLEKTETILTEMFEVEFDVGFILVFEYRIIVLTVLDCLRNQKFTELLKISREMKVPKIA